MSWKMHNVMWIILPHIHCPNFIKPPPDLIEGVEEYKVEKVLDSWKHGCGHKVQYLVKWKAYPDSDNQWVNWDDMHGEEAIAQFWKEEPLAITHIRDHVNRPEMSAHSLLWVDDSSCLTWTSGNIAMTECINVMGKTVTPLWGLQR